MMDAQEGLSSSMRYSKEDSDMCGDSLPYSDLQLLSDPRLMEEVCAGSADAFAVVFSRYHRLVHTVALRILRDAAEAEDLTQTVFLEVFRKAAQFDSSRGILKVWLLQYAYSRSINRRNYLLVRHEYNHAEVSSIDEVSNFWSPGRLQVQETNRLSSEALACLSTSQRQTIEMFFFDGLTCKEIATRTGDSYSNVRHHYYRGLQQMRSFFELITSKRFGSRRKGAMPL
jgi:RNA polymerase sigma-70 factor (ECF subfamily)